MSREVARLLHVVAREGYAIVDQKLEAGFCRRCRPDFYPLYVQRLRTCPSGSLRARKHGALHCPRAGTVAGIFKRAIIQL